MMEETTHEKDEPPALLEEKMTFQQTILYALNTGRYHMYEGTTPAHVKARRRAKNKRARAARRYNRK